MNDLKDLLREAPLFRQTVPKTGAPLNVKMSNTGDYGWVTDREGGYRYQQTHAVTGKTWPKIPQHLLEIWTDRTGEEQLPNLCLIKYYDQDARLPLG